jgi:hypothetical protein
LRDKGGPDARGSDSLSAVRREGAKDLSTSPAGSRRMFFSNMWIGRKPDDTTLQAGDDNRKLCSLYLSMMDRMGVKLDDFSDADTRLQQL